MQIRVGIDLDGCMYEFVGRLREWIHLTTGRSLDSMPDAQVWDFWSDQWGLTKDEFVEFYGAGVRAGFLLAEGEPIAGSRETVRRLFDDGHEIHIVTSRFCPNAEEAEAATRHWLSTEQIPFTTLTISDAKHATETDIFIEDSAANYAALDEAGRNPVFYTQAWNAVFPGRRVHSWDEFGSLVDALAAGDRLTPANV